MRVAQDARAPLTILDAVDRVNRNQPNLFFQRIVKHFGSSLRGKCFAIWGLSFKPNPDDIREAPSLTLIEKLLDAGAKIQACDPEAVDRVRPIFGEKVSYFTEPYDTIRGADALVLVTEWPEFRNPDPITMKKLMKSPVVFDGRNIYNPETMSKNGFVYYGVGVPKKS